MVEGECAKTQAKSETTTEKIKNSWTRDFSLQRSECIVWAVGMVDSFKRSRKHRCKKWNPQHLWWTFETKNFFSRCSYKLNGLIKQIIIVKRGCKGKYQIGSSGFFSKLKDFCQKSSEKSNSSTQLWTSQNLQDKKLLILQIRNWLLNHRQSCQNLFLRRWQHQSGLRQPWQHRIGTA